MGKVRKILTETRPEYEFTEDVDFIEAGMLDSFDVVMLVTEIEEAFGIQIAGEDIVPDNFCSIEAIEGLIRNCGGEL